MKNTDEVAIFWDYENCPAPTNTSGYAIANNIRSIAQSFGSVKLFKAYLEVKEQIPVSRAAVLRSELQSSGISLTDCPHNGRKDVADKMILVDMLAHAIDNPAPSTIILISGDRDFAYALSILRLRRYRVVLITLTNAHQSLRAQASISLDWVSDVLEPVDSHLPTSPHRGKISSPPTHDRFYSDPTGHNPSRSSGPFQESCDETSGSSVEFMNSFQDETRCSEIFRTPDARHDSLPPYLERQLATSVASDALCSGPKSSARIMDSAITSSCRTYLNGSTETLLSMTTCGPNSSKTTLTQNTSVGSTPNNAIYGNFMSSGSSAHSALQESAVNSPNLAQHKVASAIKPLPIESAMQMPRSKLAELRESDSFQQQGLHLPSVHKVTLGISPPANNIVTPSASTSRPLMLPSPLSNAIVSSVTAQSSAKLANLLRPTSFPTVLDKFKILIQCLKSHRSRGSLRPLRSEISSEIAHNGTTYRQAGVLEFGEYVAMAEQAGIVELGGSESAATAWIALKAPWFSVRLS